VRGHWIAIGVRGNPDPDRDLSDDPNVGGALRAAISYAYDTLGRMATVTSSTQNPRTQPSHRV
jgi:hypothetical protein